MQFDRDSVFISSIRSFFKTFAGVFGIVIALFVVVMGMGLMGKSKIDQAEKAEMVIAPDANGSTKDLGSNSPVIVRLDLHGVIGLRSLKDEVISAMLESVSQLKKERVKGLFVNINTPGGTATDSEGIRRAILAFKKKYDVPVYAYVDGLCASGGMMVCSAVDRVLTTPGSIIGSIGVKFGPFFNVSGSMEKVGAESKTLTKGIGKDALNPFRPWKEGEDAPYQAIIDSSYTHFVNLMVNARPQINREALINTYGARVFDPKMAQEVGYIDEGDSDYEKALTALVEKAGIEKKYQVVKLKVKHSVWRELQQGELFRGKVKHQMEIPGQLPEDLQGKVLFLM